MSRTQPEGILMYSVSICLLAIVATQSNSYVKPTTQAEFEKLSMEGRLQYIMRTAAEYSIFIESEDGERLELLNRPVLRYSDNTSGNIDSCLLLWTLKGKPQACATFYYSRRRSEEEVHEFQSLSERKLLAIRGGYRVWKPKAAGLVPRPLEDGQEVAASSAIRLAQMRRIARSFSASVRSRDVGHLKLRQLPQPVFRSGEEDSAILDSGLFAYCKGGTNPEVMVLLEARMTPAGDYAWHYSPLRMTSRSCELIYKDAVVWTGPPRGPADQTYFNLYGTFPNTPRESVR